MQESNIIININNISRSFNRRKIIDSVAFKIKKGEFFAIKGSNGSGKSTLLRLILGDYELEKGQINYFIDNNEIKLYEFLNYISFAAPYFNLYEDFTLSEHLRIYCEFRKIEFDNLKFLNFAKRFSLNEHINKQIKFYSSGMKQRAKLLLCFYSESEVIFLDEPSSNLDLEGVSILFDLLNEHKDKGKTLILASNEPKELEICDLYLSL